MTEPKLKPCPFCGGAILLKEIALMGWFVACDNEDCRAIMAYFDTEEEAIEHWNKRVGESE